MTAIPLTDAVLCHHCRVIHNRLRVDCPFCGVGGMRVAEVITKLAHRHVWDTHVGIAIGFGALYIYCACGESKPFETYASKTFRREG